MEAKRIPGKPGRSKRERIEAWAREKGWYKPAINELLEFIGTIDVPLDYSDPEPDMIQVAMTESEAWTLAYTPVGRTFSAFRKVLKEAMPLN